LPEQEEGEVRSRQSEYGLKQIEKKKGMRRKRVKASYRTIIDRIKRILSRSAFMLAFLSGIGLGRRFL